MQFFFSYDNFVKENHDRIESEKYINYCTIVEFYVWLRFKKI